jgi:hypothetical protein
MQFTLRTAERRARRFLLTFALLLAAWAVPARSALNTDYVFQSGSGSMLDTTGMTIVHNSGADDNSSSVFALGFSFVYDGNTYSQFSFNSNGLIRLGPTAVDGSRFNEDMPNSTALSNAPMIAAFWDDLLITTGNAGYKLLGSAPNRIMTINYNYRRFGSSSTDKAFLQIRLYETSNKIEYYYGPVSVTGTYSATIGAELSATNYATINPSANTITYNTSPLNSVTVPPAANTLYTLCPGSIAFTGNIAQGGTGTMANGDTLMRSLKVMRGNTASMTPFTLTATGCAAGTITFALTGVNAGDYTISPSSVTLGSGGSSTPTITFTPQGIGPRYATLTVNFGSGTRTFTLADSGTPRITYTGNIAQGGTDSMKNGQTLLANQPVVIRGTTVNYQPFTLTNINTNGAAPAASITYSIKGMSGGQFTVSPASVALGANQSSTPTISVTPTVIGFVTDTLFVNAEGQIRAFELRIFSGAPAATFTLVDKTPVTPSSLLFLNQYSCLGDGTLRIPIDITSIGGVPFTINGYQAFQLDSTTTTSKLPLHHDAQGFLTPSLDYALVDDATGAPVQFPLVIQANETRRLAVTFLGQRPTKRFARFYLRTNGQNFTGTDTAGQQTGGLLTFDLLGRGANSHLSNDLSSTSPLPKPVLFPITDVGNSSTATVKIGNIGTCTLRVSMKDLEINTGDIKEFTIVTMPTNNLDPVTGDLLIAPNTIDQQIVVKFAPIHAGTRRATMVLRTNDSAVIIPGITLRGVYYLDLVGSTPAKLAASNVDFGQALIGGGAAEQKHDVIHLENNSGFPLDIVKIIFDGADSAEFAVDGSGGFPTLPRTVLPGERLDLKVLFAPQAGGTSGKRSVKVKLVLANGDTVVSEVTGYAGTRVLTATPMNLNFDRISPNKISHKTVTITNNGTIPTRITDVILSNKNDFSMSTLARTELQPGQSEEIEVTFKPTAAGTATGTLTFVSNVPGAPAIVTLNATSARTRGVDTDPIQSTTGISLSDGEKSGAPDLVMSLSGVEGEVFANGVALRQSVPNPGRDVVEISYLLAARGQVMLALYDGNGRLVRVLDQGAREMGEQKIAVNVSDLASGVYHYRLVANGQTLARSMTVVR